MPSGGPFLRCGGPSNQWKLALVWSQRAPPGHKKCIIYVHFQQTVEKCTYHSSLHKYPKHMSGMLDLGTGWRRVALLQMLEMRSSEVVQQLPYLHLLTRLLRPPRPLLACRQFRLLILGIFSDSERAKCRP